MLWTQRLTRRAVCTAGTRIGMLTWTKRSKSWTLKRSSQCNWRRSRKKRENSSPNCRNQKRSRGKKWRKIDEATVGPRRRKVVVTSQRPKTLPSHQKLRSRIHCCGQQINLVRLELSKQTYNEVFEGLQVRASYVPDTRQLD